MNTYTVICPWTIIHELLVNESGRYIQWESDLNVPLKLDDEKKKKIQFFSTRVVVHHFRGKKILPAAQLHFRGRNALAVHNVHTLQVYTYTCPMAPSQVVEETMRYLPVS